MGLLNSNSHIPEMNLACSVHPYGFSDKVFYLFLNPMVFYGVDSCKVQPAAKHSLQYLLSRLK